ncbi:MAG: ATP-dependent RecD-like DNA helicase [Ruminococcaceae bacterium]|nr:ATP-dependent RecD-like DNA helicase [Oscillospiraceae bacterium]
MLDMQKDYDAQYVEIEGTVEHIVYTNEETGYTVCDIAIGEAELYTIVGIMPYLAEGEIIKALGNWQLHQNFGKQFKVEYYEKQLPSTAQAIYRYLASRTVKGIGAVMARRIVDKFGEDTFDVLEHHPDWLSEINGISEKKAKEIGENFKTQFGIRTVMMFCREFFGPMISVRIYQRWGVEAIDKIKENPYILCEEIYGVSFSKADAVAKSLNIPNNSEGRIRSGIKYFINLNGIQNGHCYIPFTKLIPAVADVLKVEEADIELQVSALRESGDLVFVETNSGTRVYLKKYYEAETYCTRKLMALDRLCPKIQLSDIDRFILRIEEAEDIEYASMQRKAIISAVNNGVMILTGGPGTGKTTIIKGVLQILGDLSYNIALCAPTGRAAKRMSEATQCEAKTIHRLLEMEYSKENEPVFIRDEHNLLEEDVVIVDEASMVDIFLLESLLKAMKPASRLILIGDADQLPSVGAGNVLNDLIESCVFSTVKLKEIFRQAKESLIITNAHLINSGEYPDIETKSSDFFFMPREDNEIADTIAQLCKTRLPKAYNLNSFEDIQVITPSHKGNAGTSVMNEVLQAVLNPPQKGKAQKNVRNVIFREGDKIMQIRNNYDIEWSKNSGVKGTGIFNGDIGIIRKIDQSAESVEVDFDGRIAYYDFTQLDELEHAYAITIHKSQGSEYPFVIIPAYNYSPKLLTRNLLYTAVTRAQKMVIIVGSGNVIYGMVDNNRRVLRYTGLKSWLIKAYDEQ